MMGRKFKKIMVYFISIIFFTLLFYFIWQTFVYFDIKSRSDYFIDHRDGKKYKTIRIGKQVWLAENFAYQTDKGYERVFHQDNDFGLLYDWETAKKICPRGWHLPTLQEWDVLFNELGGYRNAGNKLKSKNYWPFSFSLLKGNSGFNALPCGM